MISVLIVDDSGFMRMAIRKMIEKDPEICIVAEATTGEEAIKLAKLHKPNVITMDIEMPGQCGLEATKVIMEECPTTIIMLSSITTPSSQATIKALSYGAVDYISKVSSFVDLDIVSIEGELLKKIHYWAEEWESSKYKLNNDLSLKVNLNTNDTNLWPREKPDIVVIGASTGGPKIIPELFKYVEKLACPILIALHMPPLYTESFARYLGEVTGHKAVEGFDGMELDKNQIVIAPGGMDTYVECRKPGKYFLQVKKVENYTIHPSVDEMFISVAESAKEALGIVLSGMGTDGVKGAEKFKQRNFPVFVQDEDSCLVYGMPKAVFEAGFASGELDIAEISKKLSSWT